MVHATCLISRFWKWTIGCALVAVVLIAAIGYFRLNEALRGDYYTLDVMLMVKEYVETHDGQWPSTWGDLEETDRFKERGLKMSVYPQFVAVDFTLTSDQLIQEPDLIHHAVCPVGGGYICYPHAGDHLQDILQTIRRERSLDGQRPSNHGAINGG